MQEEENRENILLFDGVCNFCNSTVVFILKRDRKGKILFAPLQSEAGKNILERNHLKISDDPESAIFIKNGKLYQKSSAAIEVLRTIGGIYSSALVLKIFPKSVRDYVYDFISKNRYKWFGKRNTCIVPDENIRNRFLI